MSREAERDTMRTEYDFSEAVTGAHYRAYDRGTNVVLLDPDVAAVFKDSEAVNSTLRVLGAGRGSSCRRKALNSPSESGLTLS